jgi:hypothetical protein
LAEVQPPIATEAKRMITHVATLFETDTAHLLWLTEELVQKPSEMMGAKGVRIKGLVRASEDVQLQLIFLKVTS